MSSFSSPWALPDDIELAFNRYMLLPQITIEWGFMRVTPLFPFFQKPSLLRSAYMLIPELYAVSVLQRIFILAFIAAEATSCHGIFVVHHALPVNILALIPSAFFFMSINLILGS